MLKRNFFTGLVILLPMALTFWIIILIIHLLTNPFFGLLDSLISRYHLPYREFWAMGGRMVILLGLFSITIFAGVMTRFYIVKSWIGFWDRLIHKIPLINKVYKATQDVVHNLIGEEKMAFSQVVLVKFPHEKSYVLGMITRTGLPEGSDPAFSDQISVFVPGVPNPTFGFMLQYRRDQLIYLDMKVEDALKFVMSCGVMANNFKVK